MASHQERVMFNALACKTQAETHTQSLSGQRHALGFMLAQRCVHCASHASVLPIKVRAVPQKQSFVYAHFA